MVDLEDQLPDLDPLPWPDRHATGYAHAIEVSAVGRAEILELRARSARHDAEMAPGRIVVGDREVGSGIAADHDPLGRNVYLMTCLASADDA